MGVVKISGLIIALLLISCIVAGLSLFFTGMGSEYGESFNNNSLDKYNNIDSLNKLTENVRNETVGYSDKSSALDVLGSFFSDAYTTLLVTKDSITYVERTTEDSISDVNFGGFGKILKVTIIGIVVVLFFVGVVISSIVKRES